MSTATTQTSERAAARIRGLAAPTHADYKRIIDEEYAWSAVDPDACHLCQRPDASARFSEGLQVRECTNCDKPTCGDHAEPDYDFVGDPGHYVCTSWLCDTCRAN